MTTLQTADGRLLRAQRPAGAGVGAGFGWSSGFGSQWSDGTNDYADPEGVLKSYEAIYRSQPVLAGVIDKLARRIATLPLVAYEGKPTGPRKATYGDTLDTLLRVPMPRRSTVHMLTHVFQSLFIHGNTVCAKVRLNGPDEPPSWLWPLDWSKTSAYGQEGGTIEWWSTTQFGGQERFIAAADTVHWAWTAPSGSEIGVSPLEKLGTTVRLEDAVERHQIAMFRNGVRPSLAVTIDSEHAKKDQLEFARERVEAMHKGVDFAGKTFFMGANVKAQPLSLSPVEVELIQQRKLNREEVGMVFDMPGPLMGDFEHATFANVTEMLRSLYRDVIPPWTELFVQTAQVQLIDAEPGWLNRHIRFDMADKLKGDPSEQAAVDRSDVETGIRTRDEAREGRGLEPQGGMAAELTANTMSNQGPVSGMTAPESSDSASPAVNGRTEEDNG